MAEFVIRGRIRDNVVSVRGQIKDAFTKGWIKPIKEIKGSKPLSDLGFDVPKCYAECDSVIAQGRYPFTLEYCRGVCDSRAGETPEQTTERQRQEILHVEAPEVPKTKTVRVPILALNRAVLINLFPKLTELPKDQQQLLPTVDIQVPSTTEVIEQETKTRSIPSLLKTAAIVGVGLLAIFAAIKLFRKGK